MGYHMNNIDYKYNFVVNHNVYYSNNYEIIDCENERKKSIKLHNKMEF